MPDSIDETLSAKADAAFRRAAAKVVRVARQTGTPIIIWDRGEIRAISPDDIPDGAFDDSVDPASAPTNAPTAHEDDVP
jgi:hypothetical protein